MDSKRKMSSTSDGDALLSGEEDVPRKKSRNYLDSHKSIEKKRRDRINNSLTTMKDLVPDCKQYGSKKLDKAEILEMCIEYLKRVHNHLARLGGGADSLAISPREFATEISTWVLQQKPHHSNLDAFIQALLLHLSTYGSMSQSHMFASAADMSEMVMASPVTTTISLATLGQTGDSHALLQAAQPFPPPYGTNAPRILDPPHRSQMHHPIASSAGQLSVDDAVTAQEIWRNTQAMIQQQQQQQQQYATQSQDQHDLTNPQSHQPPPLVAAPEALMSSLAQSTVVKPEIDVHNKGNTQPLHHLTMPQHYQQMLVIQQPSMRPLHYPVTSEADNQHQIQQLLQQSYVANGKHTQSQEIQMTAQDIVHQNIRQQMLIAQGTPTTTKDKNLNTSNPLPVQGVATLTEELIDSGPTDQFGTSSRVVVPASENIQWEPSGVAMETTIEAGANQPSTPGSSNSKSGDLHKQSANMLLLLSKNEGETQDKQSVESTSTPVE